MHKSIRVGLVCAAFLLLAGCNKCEPEVLHGSVITGFNVTSVQQYFGIAGDSGESYPVLIFHLGPTYTQPAALSDRQSAGKVRSTWRLSLFPSAHAHFLSFGRCYPEKHLPEKVVSVSIYSDSDFNPDYPAGENLTELLINGPVRGSVPRAGIALGGVGYLPTLDLVHRFTIEIVLDSGAVHKVELDPITFPETLPSQSDYPDTPLPAPAVSTSRLNDTGIDWCADNGSDHLDCPVSLLPLQDGEVGRDALARSAALTKQGAGSAGFDFTKLDAEGNALPVSASQWHCVRDNHTGLTWEVKSTEGLRNRAHSYSWYNPDDSTNGGDPGVVNGGNCTDSACDTWGYVQAVNSHALCGLSDWRLPTREELLSVSHFGMQERAVDWDYFPDIGGRRSYWTSSVHVVHDSSAWILNPWGLYERSGFSHNQALRLVSGAEPEQDLSDRQQCTLSGVPTSAPSGHFEPLEDGSSVRHLTTNLEWQRCSVGQSWDGQGCRGPAKVYSWQQALNLAHEYPGWRLPNFKELSSIVELCRSHPAINPEAFPDTPLSLRPRVGVWTATPTPIWPNSILAIDFVTGGYLVNHRTRGLGRVRLVRYSTAVAE